MDKSLIVLLSLYCYEEFTKKKKKKATKPNQKNKEAAECEFKSRMGLHREILH